MIVKFDVEKSNYLSQITQLKGIIDANKNELGKSYELLESRKLENENLYNEVTKLTEKKGLMLKIVE